jgi:hypothetical protein
VSSYKEGTHTDWLSTHLLDHLLQGVDWVARDNTKLNAHTPIILNKYMNHCRKLASVVALRQEVSGHEQNIKIWSIHALIRFDQFRLEAEAEALKLKR